jgi:DNA-binding NtrC family response regulator
MDDHERSRHDLRDGEALGRLVGQSVAFRQLVGRLPAMARSDASVIISGETGTGKELVARALHYLSDRAPFPFVALNCGLLTDTLLGDELFGHEPGAFTDARDRRAGLLRESDRGTLLLDEVDTFSPRAQVALLRVLQERTFRSLGSAREQPFDVRFLAATNAPLASLVKAGTFRADLYYRLSVFCIELPPLRERRDDIEPLATHFLAKHARGGRKTLSRSAAAALAAYQWPGNVRELENGIIRATQVARGAVIEVEDLGLPVPDADDRAVRAVSGPLRLLKKVVTETFERDYLIRLMCEQRGNVTHAAHVAGKDRRDLGRLLKKYGLDPKTFASRDATNTSSIVW